LLTANETFRSLAPGAKLSESVQVQLTVGQPYPTDDWNPAPGQYNFANCAGGAGQTSATCTMPSFDTSKLPNGNAYPAGKPRYIYWVAHASACR
jgi:hypothetical protein